jgi:CRISPR-associated exonuclease Cas4
MILILILALIAVLAAVWFARQYRAGYLPGKVVYDDTVERIEQALVSHRYQLAGKPDHILRDRSGSLVPVERKTRRWDAREPRPGDRAQVLAYCLLVEETWGGNVDHGLLKYSDSEFRISFGTRERREIIALIAEMQAAKTAANIARSHNQPQRCRKCGVRASCDEALR